MDIVSDKHMDILTKQIPEYNPKKYKDITEQIYQVKFKQKLWFVIRHIK